LTLLLRARRQRSWPKLATEDIVKRARLLVIDDAEFPLIKSFRKDGYNMEKWNDVRDLGSLESDSFDLILLDLQGVGRGHSPDQGFGILKHIRETNPAQIVVAYSNEEWPLEYQPFFHNADAVLPKTKTDYYEFKRTVDSLLAKRFSLDYYVERAASEMHDYAGAAPKAPKKIRAAILDRKSDDLADYLKARIDDAHTVERVIQVVQIAIQMAQVVHTWTN